MPEKVITENRFADWVQFRADIRNSDTRPMGSVPVRYFSLLGRKVLAQAKTMVGCAPKHQGCNRNGIYLKWLIEDSDNGTLQPKWSRRLGSQSYATYHAPLADVDRIKVFRDWLLDEGIEVTWTDMADHEYSEEQEREWMHCDKGTGEDYPEARKVWEAANPPQGRLRRYVKLDLR